MDNEPWVIVRAAVPRHWYVKQYLVPSLVEQGLSLDHILVWQDTKRLGNLQSFINVMTWIKENMKPDAAVWLIQDDVLISSSFVKTIEREDIMNFDGAVCGYCCKTWNKSSYLKTGVQDILSKWFSFPCEKIPVRYVNEFLIWFNLSLKRNDKLGDQYRTWNDLGKLDDSFWMDFLGQCHSKDKCWNFGQIIDGVPQGGLVEHVDYIIGGSLINEREGDVRRLNYYWNEQELVERLKKDLNYKKQLKNNELTDKEMRKFIDLEKKNSNRRVKKDVAGVG